jgi:hypothetical protein
LAIDAIAFLGRPSPNAPPAAVAQRRLPETVKGAQGGQLVKVSVDDVVLPTVRVA